jgi:predicted TIM-barrel fold metal-dependent hydrolase
MIDLTDVPVVDNHCHAVEAQQGADVTVWRQFFTESPDPAMRTRDVAHTSFYRRLIRAMASFHGVGPSEDEVLRARSRYSAEDLVAALFPDASIAGVVIDTGYPAPDAAMAQKTFTLASGVRQVSLLRLEVAFQNLIAEHATYDDLEAAVRHLVADVRASGHAGFKSIAGYRTGLAIERWPEEDARAAFDRARAEVASTGAVRLGHKPLLDTLLHLAFAAAATQELPVQFHVGYGDPDADLRKASPLELRDILEDRAYRSMPVVLLHGCWPFFREGAYLASVYGNAHLDLSYAIPFLSVGEMTSMTRAALGTAPFTKLMYSSDGARVPELHWMGARDGRRAIGTVLDELVTHGDLDPDDARRAGELVLRDNAVRVYGFPEGSL